MNKDAQPYGPWLRASPDHLQKPQVVRVSGQDTHQVNHGTKSPGNLRRTVAEQVRSTGDMVQHKVLLNPNISGTSSPPVHHVPKDPEFPSIQKISAIPIDFEAHIREIDRVLEWKVSEMVEKDKEISNSISPLSNDVASKSNGADITPLHGPTLEGPQGEVNKVPVAFVMGLGDNFTQVANRKGGIVHVQPKKSGQYTKGKGGCKGTKVIAKKKKKKKTETFEDMVVEIQKEEPKRKFEGWTNSTTSGSEKKIKLDDVMSLGKVFKDQFGSAEVARQPRWAQ